MNLSNVLLLPGFFVLFALICSAEVSRLVQTMRESRHESERERKNPHWCSYALGATKSSIVRPGPAGFSSLFFASPALYAEREGRRRGKADTSSPGGGSKASRQILFGNRACCFVHQPEKFLSAELLYTPFGWASDTRRRLATLCGGRLFASASS
jgi:hypothetical protein